MVTALFVALAAAESPDNIRWERKVARCEGRLVEVEGRWVEVCDVVDAKGRERRLQRLIGQRARHDRARARLEAVGAPSVTVDVFVATNRAPEGEGFGRRDGPLTYGVATVWIPPEHARGAIEPDLAVVGWEPLSAAAWQSRLRGASGPDVGLLTYVHGYNNSFDDAVLRGAQVAHDVRVPVVPVVFAWPAAGGTWFSGAKYTYDENAAARSAAPFARFFGELLTEQPSPVALVAHSMGSRVVADGLVDLQRRRPDLRRVDELVFAAPDVDAGVFADRYAEVALGMTDRITVYCADDDRALKVSRQVHGGYDRLGSCRRDSLVPLAGPRVEVVDASTLYVNLVDHDKLASSPRLLEDLRHVLVGVAAGAPERRLHEDGPRYLLPP